MFYGMGVISFYSLLEVSLMLHIKITFAFSGSHQSQPGVTDQYTQDFLRVFHSQGKSCYDLKGHDLAFHPVLAILNPQLLTVFYV